MLHHVHASHSQSPSGRGLPPITEKSLEGGGTLGKIEASPWLWGALATCGFYQAIPHLPFWKEEATRYFCSHPVEYIEVGFFFIGMAIVLDKFNWLRRERHVFNTLTGLTPPEADREEPLETQLTKLEERLDRASLLDKETYWYSRLDYLRKFLSNRRTDGLDDHLTFLAETAEAKLYEGHALLQMIIWAIPILGFLGTVMGITLAIANITPEQLESSLNTVTGGLSVAFDTTAIGLMESLVLGFASLFVRHSEERLLTEIDHRVRADVRQTLSSDEHKSAWVEAEAKAAHDLLETTGTLIESQTTLWKNSVEEFRQRWTHTLDEQRLNLARTLTTGSEATLVDHAEQLDQFRREFVNAYQAVTTRLGDDLQRLENSASSREQRFEQALERFSSDFHLRLKAMWDARERDDAFRSALTQSQLESWQRQMAALTEVMRDMSMALTGQSETLLKIYDHEENLVGMQQRLTENLEALRATETFESAVHQLTGAVHLLMVRARRDAA